MAINANLHKLCVLLKEGLLYMITINVNVKEGCNMRKFMPIMVIAAVILTFCTTASYAQGVIPPCPGEALVVGQVNYCFCASECCPVEGSFCNIAVPSLQQCMDIGDIHYCNSFQQSFCFIVIPDQDQQCNPAIDIEKSTNGEDADTAPGPTIQAGDPVSWDYTVTNTGDVVLSDVQIVDDQLGSICILALLNPGGMATCGVLGTAVAGQYSNVGTVTATVGTLVVTDSDPSNYFGEAAAIDIEKSTNGNDADSAPGPTIIVGDPVTWTYMVTNTGNVPLNSITVVDNKGVAVTCPKTTLAVGESMTCTASSTAIAGQYSNLGTAEGTAPSGRVVTDSDLSHYSGATLEACCFEDFCGPNPGTCTELTSEGCIAAGGSPQGAATSCATTSCLIITTPQACCFTDGSCAMAVPDYCSGPGGLGGTPAGCFTQCLGDSNGNGIDDVCDPQP